MTTARTGFFPFPAIFVSKHRVPANNVLYLPSSAQLYKVRFDGKGFLITGTLSPVNIDSFITDYPVNNIKSQGII